VAYWRKKTALFTTLTRDGSAVNYNTYSKRIQRQRPSAPLLLVNSDDNVLDLYFKDGSNSYYRPTLYVVIDAFNDYILGYAMGDTLTIGLIEAAYRDAVHHVHKLVSGELGVVSKSVAGFSGSSSDDMYYLWHQIQTDHWNIDPKKEGRLASYFKNQAHFTPATVKVAQAKYIERTFGVLWHQQLKFFPNYGGYNVSAKTKLNPDAVQLAKKDFPAKEEAPAVVARFIESMRATVSSTNSSRSSGSSSGVSRQEEWLEAFKNSLKSKERRIDVEKRLQLFGIVHPHKNKITAEGIRVTVNRRRITYDISNDLYIQNVGKTVQITYDPYDMGRVLVSDGRGLRFVAQETVKMPSALADFKEGDRAALNSKLDFKKQINKVVLKGIENRAAILSRAQIDANSILQAGVKTKALSHGAMKTVGPQRFGEQLAVGSEPEKQNRVEDEEVDWRELM
jgi:hypothetical protein